MDRIIEFVPLLTLIQEHISKNYAAALTDEDKQKQLIPIINKFLYDTGYSVRGMSKDDLAKKLYSEMAEYSVITPFLNRDDVEEINVNAWNNIVITYTDGRMEHLSEHFYSPQNAEDIVKRLLHLSATSQAALQLIPYRQRPAMCLPAGKTSERTSVIGKPAQYTKTSIIRGNMNTEISH